MIIGIAHINLLVPEGTLPHALNFYGTTLGLIPSPVPVLQKNTLAWLDIPSSAPPGGKPQQVHIAIGTNDPTSSRHPCFKIADESTLRTLQERVYAHYLKGSISDGDVTRDGDAEGYASAPMTCDKPGDPNSGAKGAEYPTRFFARDFAGNRLEFSV